MPHNCNPEPWVPTVSQAPQLPAVSQVSPVSQQYSSLVAQYSAAHSPAVSAVSQAPRFPAVSLVSPVPQHYAGSLVPQHSAAHSSSLLSTGSTSQTPQTTHQVSRTTKWRRLKETQCTTTQSETFASTVGNQQQVQCF